SARQLIHLPLSFFGKKISPQRGHLLPISCGFSSGEDGVAHSPAFKGICFAELIDTYYLPIYI
ncbi:MAG: hypothetical protein Q8O16_00105, partial [Dehalococcoidia bacterium]|nr:hypothetical protein [Dehalococcoidia bacterium]